MKTIVKILVARNKETKEVFKSVVLGGEDDSDKRVTLEYDISLFSFEELKEAMAGFSEYTIRQIAGHYILGENFTLEQEAWNLPSIGKFEVIILTKEIEL